VLVRVRMAGEARRGNAADLDAEFLAQFALECGFGGFTRFKLAAGKFPQVAKRFIGRAARDEDAVVRIDERDRDHEQNRRTHGWA